MECFCRSGSLESGGVPVGKYFQLDTNGGVTIGDIGTSVSTKRSVHNMCVMNLGGQYATMSAPPAVATAVLYDDGTIAYAQPTDVSHVMIVAYDISSMSTQYTFTFTRK